MKKCITLFTFLSLACSLLAQSELSYADKDSVRYIPVDMHDCFCQLDSLLADTVRNKIQRMDEDTFCAKAHFELGMWMRNNWKLWGNSRLWEYFHKLGLSHPDDMSGLILQSYHRYLNGKPLRIRAYVQKTKRYSRKYARYHRQDARKCKQRYDNAYKIIRKWDIHPTHNWEDCGKLLHIPIIDSVTGSCVKFRAVGDTLGTEELDYLKRNRADACVIPYDNNACFIPQLESFINCWTEFADMLPHKGCPKKVKGKGLTIKEIPFTYNVSYNMAGQIVDLRSKMSGDIWKEIHQYDSLGRRSMVELYRNDTIMERYHYTYDLDTYHWSIEKRAQGISELQTHPYSYICTMDRTGRVIQECKMVSDSTGGKKVSSLCETQYNQYGNLTNMLFYKDGKLSSYSSEVYDNHRNIEYSFGDDDVEYNSSCWISLLSKYGDCHCFENLDYLEETFDYDWNDFCYDRYGNMKRFVNKENGHKTTILRCRIRYW